MTFNNSFSYEYLEKESWQPPRRPVITQRVRIFQKATCRSLVLDNATQEWEWNWMKIIEYTVKPFFGTYILHLLLTKLLATQNFSHEKIL